MNIWDIVVFLLVALAVGLAVRSMVRARHRGKCGSCPYCEGCERQHT